MADVQKIKAAVGEDDAATGGPLRFGECGDLRRVHDLTGARGPIEREAGHDFLPRNGRAADLFDFQSACDVGQLHGVGRRDARAEAETDHREHHVPRAGDVVHGPGLRRIDFAAAVGRDQGHAVAIERDDAEVELMFTGQLPPGADRVVGRFNLDAGRELRFQAIRGHRRGTAITRVVGAANRVDDHRLAEFAGGVDHLTEQPRRADPLVVIGDEHDVAMFQRRRQARAQFMHELGAERIADFVVDAEDLMRMPALGAADEAFFRRRRTLGVVEHERIVDAELAQHPAYEATAVVVADHAGQADLGLETSEHVADVGRAAESGFALIGAQQDHGSFLAHAFGVAPGVAVENQIAEHQHARTCQAGKQRDEIRHRGSSLTRMRGRLRNAEGAGYPVAGITTKMKRRSKLSDAGDAGTLGL